MQVRSCDRRNCVYNHDCICYGNSVRINEDNKCYTFSWNPKYDRECGAFCIHFHRVWPNIPQCKIGNKIPQIGKRGNMTCWER